MDANEDKLLLKHEVFQIVGCAIEVLNALGHGLIEKPYENALVVEFGLQNIPFRQQSPFDVLYKGHKIGLFVPDLIAFDSVVVDTKVIEGITNHERGLILNYLRITNLRVGGSSTSSTPNWSGSGLSCECTSTDDPRNTFVFIGVHSWLR